MIAPKLLEPGRRAVIPKYLSGTTRMLIPKSGRMAWIKAAADGFLSGTLGIAQATLHVQG
jgi:hypothetical protein